EQQFYLSDGRFYCKQDYLYNMERKVLSALNRNYHPACFTCTACGMCLDGVQFALDKNNQVYCLPDYHERFAPRCHRCKNAILPDE
ncbi:LIM domain protein, partial [Teladorsagia circumcincta]